ncbi:MAG: 50S ribosomal protein L24 [Candidatus Paceibacterota bacterium]|nr:50S ribosomal protein L24 [Candidatus Paceibacterota bacterium]
MELLLWHQKSFKSMNIKKDDIVMIISGDDKGRKAKVLRVLPKEGRIMVEGVNMLKKHQKPKKEGEKGQIVAKEGLINACKAMIVCPKCGKATRINIKRNAIDSKVRKSRICKKCKEVF